MGDDERPTGSCHTPDRRRYGLISTRSERYEERGQESCSLQAPLLGI